MRGFNPNYPHPDDVRMTLGEHLEELRTRLIRAIVAVGIGALLCYAFIDYLMAFLTWPLFAVMKKQGLEPQITFLNLPEPFITDLKIAVIVGIIISAPYSITQIWGFIAAGLYAHERKWVRRFMPVSVALFFSGVFFFLVVAAPLLVSFLISYRRAVPDVSQFLPTVLIPVVDNTMASDGTAESQPAISLDQPLAGFHWPKMPVVTKNDPPEPPECAPWINLDKREVRVRYGKQLYRIAKIEPIDRQNAIAPDIRLGEYITFILHLAAAFGIGFQVPVVVAFVATIGMATAAEMGRLRRYVWFGLSIGSAVITPPDISSMLLLFIPMCLLYEVGLFASRFIEQERRDQPE